MRIISVNKRRDVIPKHLTTRVYREMKIEPRTIGMRNTRTGIMYHAKASAASIVSTRINGNLRGVMAQADLEVTGREKATEARGTLAQRGMGKGLPVGPGGDHRRTGTTITLGVK